MWTIVDGIISLELEDGGVFYPCYEELHEQCNMIEYVFDGTSYPPISTLALRISSIGLTSTQITLNKDVKMSLRMSAIKRGQSYAIPYIETKAQFADYVIIGTACYPVYGSCQDLNKLLLDRAINPLDFNYAQYMDISRSMREMGYEIEQDNISINVEELRRNEELVYAPKGLQADLFPYQKSGLNWLSFMVDSGCGSILGDEMGLGKTLQVIATIGYIKEKRGSINCLVVCPVSLLENWRREVKKFYPSLSVLVNHGSNRTRLYIDLLQYDIVVTAYSNLQTDSAMLQMIDWDLIVTDEAQNIKNPRALRTRYLKMLKKKTAIAVSGTPFENHMTDVWSLVDFVMPNYLGTLSSFEQTYGDDLDSAKALEKLITPIMIRRRVKDVGKSLPPRIDVPVPITMTLDEARFYEDGRLAAQEDFGLADMQLEKIQKLRMFCTHPIVYDSSLAGSDPIKLSNKYARLCELLEEIFMYKEKVIVFTSFSKMIQLIVDDISKRFGVYTNFIDGSVSSEDRQKIVDEFSSVSGPGLLALNPIAAGTGLNITAANHVIHYNLEWNPSKEDQASARAYRTGQKKTVVVHRLFYVDTIEEIINDMIQRKREISDTTIVGHVGESDSKEQLVYALSKSPYKEGE